MATSPTELFRARRSRRLFLDDRVPDGVVSDILDCGRLAPSANNLQPWLLGAITDPVLLRRIADLADHGRFISRAPVCFAVFALAKEKYFLEDGCAATMNIILASQAHGLGACWVAGHKKAYGEEVRRLLEVPEGFILVSLVAAGKPADDPSPRKKPVSEVTFKDRYAAAKGGGNP